MQHFGDIARRRLVRSRPRIEWHTVDPLHGKHRLPVDPFGAVDRDDIGMVQRGDRFDFPLKTGSHFRRDKGAGRDTLERDNSTGARLNCAIDDALAARTQDAQQQVLAEPSEP